MSPFCSNCGQPKQDHMRFCPHCGADVGLDTEMGARPPQAVPRYGASPQGQGPWPMAPYPYPMFYRPPMTVWRLSSMAGGIILLIDAIMALMLSVLLVFEIISIGLAVFMLVASITAIISSVGVFMSFNPLYIIMGPLMLLIGAFIFWVFEPAAAFISIIGSILAIVSVVLLVIGWKDSVARNETRKMGLHPSMAGPGQVYPQAPTYGSVEPPPFLNTRR